MIEIRSEMHQCFCQKCNNSQIEQLVYEKVTCKNVMHAALTAVTGVWLLIWLYKRKESKNETAHNQRLALLALTCKKCGGPLALSRPNGLDISALTLE